MVKSWSSASVCAGKPPSFTNISRRHSEGADESYAAVRTAHAQGRYVQQFKFLRLSKNLNYANRMNIPFVVLIGEAEIEQEFAQV